MVKIEHVPSQANFSDPLEAPRHGPNIIIGSSNSSSFASESIDINDDPSHPSHKSLRFDATGDLPIEKSQKTESPIGSIRDLGMGLT